MPASISILYVDDEPCQLELDRQFLESTGEFVVSTAESVDNARNMLSIKAFNVIVSDY